MVCVGQTKRPSKTRIVERKTAIRNQNMDFAIARHYMQASRSSTASLCFWGIEKILPSPRGGDKVQKLFQREAF